MNTISTKAMIISLGTQFGIDTSRNNDIVMFLGDVIQEIGCYLPMEKTYKDVPVHDSRAKIPCEAIDLLKIEDKSGCRLLQVSMAEVYDTGSSSPIEGGYGLNPGYIITPYSSGTLRIYFVKVPTCKDGLPLVLNAANYKEACKWGIMLKLLSNGSKHPVFDFNKAWEMYNDIYLPRAQSEAKRMALDLASFGQMWNRSFGEVYASPSGLTTDTGIEGLANYERKSKLDLSHLSGD